MEKNAIDSPVPEAPIITPSAPQKLWTPLTVSLTVFVVAIVLSIIFFDTIVNQPVIKRLLTGVRYQSDELSDSNMFPTSTPSPYPIAQGRQVYNVNSSAKGPEIGKVTINPLDARIGQTQTIDVTIKSTSAVSGVMVAIRTDKNVITNHKLAVSSGTATNGVWSGDWKMEVIHDYLYQVIITATNAETSNSTTVTIR